MIALPYFLFSLLPKIIGVERLVVLFDGVVVELNQDDVVLPEFPGVVTGKGLSPSGTLH